MYLFFFFVKQKTAYEMRISDWSSDVCSSDLWRVAVTTTRSSSVAGTDAAVSAGVFASGSTGPAAIATPAIDAKPRPTHAGQRPDTEIGRASCRERGCQYV